MYELDRLDHKALLGGGAKRDEKRETTHDKDSKKGGEGGSAETPRKLRGER